MIHLHSIKFYLNHLKFYFSLLLFIANYKTLKGLYSWNSHSSPTYHLIIHYEDFLIQINFPINYIITKHYSFFINLRDFNIFISRSLETIMKINLFINFTIIYMTIIFKALIIFIFIMQLLPA